MYLGGFARQIALGIGHLAAIVGGADLAHAGGCAAFDLILQAGAGAALELAVGAVAQQKHPLQLCQGAIDRAGAGKGAKIGAFFLFCAAMLFDHRVGVIGDQNIGERFVIAQQHIIARL